MMPKSSQRKQDAKKKATSKTPQGKPTPSTITPTKTPTAPKTPTPTKSPATSKTPATPVTPTQPVQSPKPVTRKDKIPNSAPKTIFGRQLELHRRLIRERIPELLLLGTTLILIFGGCCTDVYALEAVIKDEPGAGPLLTLVQFIFVALTSWPSQFDHRQFPTFLAKRKIPFWRLIVNVLLFYSINMLNNHAFSYNISVPIHIILRSGGSITTLIAGFLWGKKFSWQQVSCVVLLTAGIVTAAWSDAANKGKTGSSSENSFGTGLMVLLLAQVLSAIQGIYTEETYKKYGKHWQENLFYSHFLSIPLFLGFTPQLMSMFKRFSHSPPLDTPSPSLLGFDEWPQAVQTVFDMVEIPSQLAFLTLNVLFQWFCITGVNRLAAECSALAVTIVLNVRKLVSLMLSIWLFGNRLSPGTLIGAGVAFVASGLYTLSPARSITHNNDKNNKRKAKKKSSVTTRSPPSVAAAARLLDKPKEI